MIAPAAASHERRLVFLDVIRGVAALTVAIGHTADKFFLGFRRWQVDWFSPGRSGVCAFFLVSGFVIPMSIERGGGLRRFGVRRFFRLYPMYWVSLAAILLASTVHDEALPPDFAAETPLAATVNLTMLQRFVGVPDAMDLYFTLALELVWYATCAVLFVMGLLHRTFWLASACIVGLAAVGIGAPLLFERHVPFVTGFYVATMFVGTAFARAAAGQLSLTAVAFLVTAVGVVAVVGGWANYSFLPPATDPQGVLRLSGALAAWGIAYAIFIGAFLARRRQFPRSLAFLGLVSYSVYLLHPPVMSVAAEVTDRPWLAFGLTVAATVAISAVTQRWIERPGQELGRRFGREPEPHARPAPADRRTTGP